MSFYKESVSNIQNNEIVEIIEDLTCEKCGIDLNMLRSKGGEIKCQKCGFETAISEDNDA